MALNRNYFWVKQGDLVVNEFKKLSNKEASEGGFSTLVLIGIAPENLY